MVTLDLSHAEIKEEDLAPLEELLALRCLCLQGTKISDRAVSYLADLASLKILNLFGTQITDVAMEYFPCMAGLEQLYIGATKTRISSQSMMALTRCPTLRYLDLEGSYIDDERLEVISQISELEGVNIFAYNYGEVRQAFTEKGLLSLLSLKKLRLLGLGRPKAISDAVIEQFKQIDKMFNVVPGGCAGLYTPRDQQYCSFSVIAV